MSNREFSRHNGLIALIAILLVLILVGGIIGGLYYFNRCLFGHDYGEDGVCTRCGKEKLDEVQKEKDPESANDKEAAVNGGGMATVLPGNGIQLLAAKMPLSAAAPAAVTENTWTLTASVNESADDKYINWSVRWKDAQNSWAKGKTVTEYVTVTPTQAGALTATVKVLKDFGAQIEVVATSRDNSSRSATCVFDYVQKITGITFNIPSIESAQTSFTYSFNTTNYTVASEQSITVSDKLVMTKDFIDKWRSCVGYCGHPATPGYFQIVSNPKITVEGKTLKLSKSDKIILTDREEESYSESPLSSATGACGGIEYCSNDFVSLFVAKGKNASWNAEELIYCFNKMGSMFSPEVWGNFTVTYKATYGGKTYSEGTKTVDVNLTVGSIHVPVYDVTLDQTHIYA